MEKILDNNKICFILCTNNQQYTDEALYFINKLHVPEGYTVDVLTVQEAKSMTAGYNEAMEASDAKYKIYMHQDVMIVEPDFLQKLLDVFADETVGMIGMVGAPKLGEDFIMWHCPRVGKIYTSNAYKTQEWVLGEVEGTYQEVEVIDGLLMATQYDVIWREDLFDKWDFYDVSGSFEMHKAGYKVVVPNMDKPWVLHDDGFMNLDNYYGECEKAKKEYN